MSRKREWVSVGAGNIAAVHAHLASGKQILVASAWKPMFLTAQAQISADGQGYRVPAGPRSRRTVYAFADQVRWLKG